VDEATELKKILLQLAANYEEHRSGYVSLRGETIDEDAWLSRTLALLRSEGSLVDFGGCFRFTPAGYQTYLPQIQAARRTPSPKSPSTINAAGGIDTGLLLKIMKRLGEIEATYPALIMSNVLFELAPEAIQKNGAPAVSACIDAHLKYLYGRGFVELGQPAMLLPSRRVTLTVTGHTFVQPELAEFGQPPILPEVIDTLESRMQILSYPSDETSGLMYSLRDAIRSQGSGSRGRFDRGNWSAPRDRWPLTGRNQKEVVYEAVQMREFRLKLQAQTVPESHDDARQNSGNGFSEYPSRRLCGNPQLHGHLAPGDAASAKLGNLYGEPRTALSLAPEARQARYRLVVRNLALVLRYS
jgi:hypothetical protein